MYITVFSLLLYSPFRIGMDWSRKQVSLLTALGRTRPHLMHPTVPLLWQVTKIEYWHCPLKN